MCIAIVKPQGKEITDSELENCYTRNPDGAGLAFAKDGKLYILKGIFNKKEFVDSVRKYEKVAEGAMLIHCRIGTSGLKDKENCHPHIISKELVMIHNGILRIKMPNDSKLSDTAIFSREILSKFPNDFIKDQRMMELIEMAIGSNNKLCFLNNKGEYAIANERQGYWDKGVWFSNKTYEDYKPLAYYGGWDEDDYIDCTGKRFYKWNGYDYVQSNNKQKEEKDKMEKFNQLTIKNLKLKDDGLPSKSRIKKLKKMIRNMSDKKMYDIGQFPLYDKINNAFAEYRPAFNANQYVCLDEYSTEVFEEWMYEYDERFGETKTFHEALKKESA